MISKLGLHGRNEIDLVIECSGAEPCIQTGLLLLKKRGTLVQVSGSDVVSAILLMAGRQWRGDYCYPNVDNHESRTHHQRVLPRKLPRDRVKMRSDTAVWTRLLRNGHRSSISGTDQLETSAVT